MPTELEIVKVILESDLFDSDWYLQQNPDVRIAGVDPLLHYLRHGEAEKRSPAPGIDLRKIAPNIPAGSSLLYQYAQGKTATIQKEPVRVAFCTDGNYLPYLSVALLSLIRTSDPRRQYDVYVIHSGISQERLARLTACEAPNVNITAIPFERYAHLLSQNAYTSAHISRGAYIRILLPSILTHVGRVLYLDCDLLVCKDAGELYDQELGGKMLGSVHDYMTDSPYSRQLAKSLPIEVSEDYFNSGVILFDLGACRDFDFTHKCLSLANSGREFICHDQDVINIAAQGTIKSLPSKWNYFWHILAKSEHVHLSSAQLLRYLKDFSNPHIIHFTSHYKPWNYNDGHFAAQFWQVAAFSPFYQEMREACPYSPDLLLSGRKQECA